LIIARIFAEGGALVSAATLEAAAAAFAVETED
jgi:hypothetical protein